ncbi:single-stranded DNA-binding protein [Calothrix sp. PCC 6303]|uniref:single-stranded DNA-binding protein n=1 Tax=Calothrix sp. PCC 6303 TaxID=1170562 RepID=UPI0002A01928|nr:single-stranded DNA-binding protein [Calothrix sp. PCC 6303]AFZ02181.1 single-strand binding protein [Calothrix sp. PCC 6303]
MNSCVLMAEITNQPQLRHTPDGLELAEMMIQFSGTRPDDPPAMMRAIGWGNMAKEIHANYHQGDRVLLEGRLNMNTIDRPEGFKEKRAELTVQRIHSLGNIGIPSDVQPTYTSSPAPVMEQPPAAAATNTRKTPPPNRTPAATPSYEAPPAAPARTNVTAKPQYNEPDPDDIPFMRSLDSITVKAGLLDIYEIATQCPQVGISHKFKFI